MHITIDSSLCTGCGACQLICSLYTHGVINPHIGLIKLEADDFVMRPSLCHQCGNPFCLKVCPRDAIKKANGVVTINREKCIGCKICQRYCPYDAIIIKDKKAYKCELCGGDPQCVKVCGTGALSICNKKGVEACGGVYE